MTMPNQIRIPEPVHALLCRLNDAGFCAYAVGGCVRDSLLGKTPKDWDICTAAPPDQIKACFQNERTILTGERYGTVTVLYGGSPYEITTFRTENGYSDSRHPDRVVFVQTLQGDLARRDFTVNAMAADASGSITDCFGGMEDLKNGILRCVGTAHERFSEDALRILRALRFSSVLGFPIEPATADAIHELKERLSAVAPERLRKELCGLLCGEHAASVLRTYADVLCVLIPELCGCIGFHQYNYHHIHDVWEHTVRAVELVPPTEALRFAALLHDIGKPCAFTMDKQLIGHFYDHAAISAAMTETILRRLRFDSASVSEITLLVREHGFSLPQGSEKRMRRLLSAFGEETVRQLLALRRADALATGTVRAEEAEAFLQDGLRLLEQTVQAGGCLSLKQLALNGSDLIALGLAPGPAVGNLLNELLSAVVDGKLENTRAALLQYAQNQMQKPETD